MRYALHDTDWTARNLRWRCWNTRASAIHEWRICRTLCRPRNRNLQRCNVWHDRLLNGNCGCDPRHWPRHWLQNRSRGRGRSHCDLRCRVGDRDRRRCYKQLCGGSCECCVCHRTCRRQPRFCRRQPRRHSFWCSGRGRLRFSSRYYWTIRLGQLTGRSLVCQFTVNCVRRTVFGQCRIRLLYRGRRGSNRK